MIVLGVDPGLARCGVAIVEGEPGHLILRHADCIETKAGLATAARLAHIFAAVEKLIGSHRPDAAAVEQLFMASNRRSVMGVAEARGAALCALGRARVQVAEYTPLQVKESVAGWGAADKAQVARMACTLLNVAAIPGPDDTTDACAIAITHHHRGRLAGLVPGPALSRRPTPGLSAAVEAARVRRSVPR